MTYILEAICKDQRPELTYCLHLIEGVTIGFEVGKTYTVIFNGERYICVGTLYGSTNMRKVSLGNQAVNDPSRTDTGEPFMVMFNGRSDSVSVIWQKAVGDTVTVGVIEGAGGEETEPLSFLRFKCGLAYPYLPKNIFGWKLAQKQ